MFAETPGFWKTDAAGNAEQKPEEEKNISESRDFQKPEQGEAVKSGASERANRRNREKPIRMLRRVHKRETYIRMKINR